MNIIFENQNIKKIEPKQHYETIFSHFLYNNQLTHKQNYWVQIKGG